ncbi:MAG: hypothetical protein ABMA64_11770 [Myxococcota bacterium]
MKWVVVWSAVAGCGAPVYFPNEPPPVRVGSTGDTAAAPPTGDTGPVDDTAPPPSECSTDGGAAATLTVRNVGAAPLDVWWRDGACAEHLLGTALPGVDFGQYTWTGHVFVVRSFDGAEVGVRTIDAAAVVWEVP